MSATSPPSTERISQDLEELASIVEDGPGWTRRVFSEADRAGRERVAEIMRSAGLEARLDAAGNVIGTLAGTAGGGPALVTGSHTDTVLGGGRFDGIVGVLGAVEVTRLLRERGIRLRHDLRIVDFLGEEPNDFGSGYLGSRALTGTLLPAHLAMRDDRGERLADALRRAGGDPDGALRAQWSPSEVAAYFELHVEQGPNLEELGKPLGAVTAIVGIERLTATFRGRQDHAGTMPMARRRDAGCAAAEGMLAIERLAVEGATGAARGGAVGTTGWVELRPGATNVVPGQARLRAEGRSIDAEWLAAFRANVEAELVRAGAARTVDVDVDWLEIEAPTPMAQTAMEAITGAAHRLGYPLAPLASFAGHDAAQMAALGPVGMIFVPSRGGRSHCPEEWTDLSDVAIGVDTLAEALLIADGIY